MKTKEWAKVVFAGFSVAYLAAAMTVGFFLTIIGMLGLTPAPVVISGFAGAAGGWFGTLTAMDKIKEYRKREGK